jgi:L-2-hydroxyglutarate oxidase LhgO
LRKTFNGSEKSGRGSLRVLTKFGGQDADWVVAAAGVYSERMAAKLGAGFFLKQNPDTTCQCRILESRPRR